MVESPLHDSCLSHMPLVPACTPAAVRCRLVGVARVPKVSEAFLDIFLMLPTDALAVMKARLEFS
jgi:hypothetical protein